MIQQWDFLVEEPVSLVDWRRQRLAEHLPTVAQRLARGESLRDLATAYGVSHEAVRRALLRGDFSTRRPTAPAATPRRTRPHRRPGRGRSTALTPAEVAAVRARHAAGESMRSLGRAFGISHETIRRRLAAVMPTGDHSVA